MLMFGNGLNRVSIDLDAIDSMKINRKERKVDIIVKKQVWSQASRQLQNGKTSAQEWVINQGFLVSSASVVYSFPALDSNEAARMARYALG